MEDNSNDSGSNSTRRPMLRPFSGRPAPHTPLRPADGRKAAMPFHSPTPSGIAPQSRAASPAATSEVAATFDDVSPAADAVDTPLPSIAPVADEVAPSALDVSTLLPAETPRSDAFEAEQAPFAEFEEPRAVEPSRERFDTPTPLSWLFESATPAPEPVAEPTSSLNTSESDVDAPRLDAAAFEAPASEAPASEAPGSEAPVFEAPDTLPTAFEASQLEHASFDATEDPESLFADNTPIAFPTDVFAALSRESGDFDALSDEPVGDVEDVEVVAASQKFEASGTIAEIVAIEAPAEEAPTNAADETVAIDAVGTSQPSTSYDENVNEEASPTSAPTSESYLANAADEHFDVAEFEEGIVSRTFVESPIEDVSAASSAPEECITTAEAPVAPPGDEAVPPRVLTVAETLEGIAHRVRLGEIVVAADAGASPEAVLASVLASLLTTGS